MITDLSQTRAVAAALATLAIAVGLEMQTGFWRLALNDFHVSPPGFAAAGLWAFTACWLVCGPAFKRSIVPSVSLGLAAPPMASLIASVRAPIEPIATLVAEKPPEIYLAWIGAVDLSTTVLLAAAWLLRPSLRSVVEAACLIGAAFGLSWPALEGLPENGWIPADLFAIAIVLPSALPFAAFAIPTRRPLQMGAFTGLFLLVTLTAPSWFGMILDVTQR